MRKKMYWGIASLILIIGVVGVYFMLQPEPEPETRYKLPSEAENKQEKDVNQLERQVSEVVKPPPPGASPNGHWHGDEWHDESHQTPISYTPKGTQLSYEEALKQFFKEQREAAEKIVTQRMEDLMKVARKGATYNLTNKNREILRRQAPIIREQNKLFYRAQAGDILSDEELKRFYALSRQQTQMYQESRKVWEGYEAEVEKIYNEILEQANWEGYEAEVNKLHNRRIGKPENIITEEEYYRRMEEQSNDN